MIEDCDCDDCRAALERDKNTTTNGSRVSHTPPVSVCPHCGRCPTCGRGPQPWYPAPYYPPHYPPYYPWITWTAVGGSEGTYR
jgi:hypothetical protein